MKTLAREKDITEILGRVRLLDLECQRQWGQMTVHQAVCHLSDACRMALGETAVSPTGGLVQRTVIKWIALYAPMKWPPGIVTRPELDQHVSGTKPSSFADDLAELEALVRRLAVHRTRISHPIFGAMSESDWLRWGYLHLDHHLRQFGK
jgi:hypothetical protein